MKYQYVGTGALIFPVAAFVILLAFPMSARAGTTEADLQACRAAYIKLVTTRDQSITECEGRRPEGCSSETCLRLWEWGCSMKVDAAISNKSVECQHLALELFFQNETHTH